MYFTKDFFTDSALMYDYLEQLHLYTGSERSGEKFFTRPKGTKKPESTKYGWTWKKYLSPTKNREYDPTVGLYKTKLLVEYPELMDIFKEYSNIHFPNLEWKQVTINKMESGNSIKEHVDKINVGDSVLVAFGDYEGGLTYVEGMGEIDCRTQITRFNGSKLKHSVSVVHGGKRYSLVFYNNKTKPMADYQLSH